MSPIHNSTNLLVNTGSMIGQLATSRAETALTKSIRNLSTGVRIHSASDDPAGFVASTLMQTDIVSMNQAVKNSQRADAAISATDSALGTLNNLLNDLRGLVTQAANSGVESRQTLAAMQLEADAILNTIDYISNSTVFQNSRLLDGSLDFTTYGVDGSKISDLSVYEANFQGRTEKDVSVQVLQSAQQAELYYPLGALKESVVLDVSGSGGSHSFSFDKSATVEQIADTVNRLSDSTGVGAKLYSQATASSLAVTSYGNDNDIILTATEAGTEAGNFVVRYTAPTTGNESAYLKVTEGTGNDPTVIEVVLQTQTWEKAEYAYSDYGDGLTNNKFSIAAKYAGDEFNDIQFEFVNVYGTEQEPGLEADLKSSPKAVTVYVSYNEANPDDPTNTTVNDLAAWIDASPSMSTYFEIRNTPPSDGSGPLIPTTTLGQTKSGVDGGAVLTTAEEVATLINTSPLLKNIDGSGKISATLPSGSSGRGVVSAFQEYSYYGNPDDSNYLQFLAPEGTANIKFVSTPGTPLSIDDTSYPAVYGKSSVSIQGLDAGTSFTLQARNLGKDADGVGVIFRDSADESAVFDAEQNAVVISVDFTGRAADPNREAFSIDDLVQMVAEDPITGSMFEVVPNSSYDVNNPPRFENEAYLGIDSKLGETSGGVVSEGTIIINLETDAKGIVKTTANDLVQFFNNPSNEESKAVLDRLGISVSIIDPLNANLTACVSGLGTYGSGVLAPTYDNPNCPADGELYPDIVFASSGENVVEKYPSGTVSANNGLNAQFSVTALQEGSALNNTTVRVVKDPTGPTVQYNTLTRELTVGVASNDSLTAEEVIELINSDPDIGQLFKASKVADSTGEGFVSVGDLGVLTGGVTTADVQAEGSLISSGGANASFSVQVKKTDAQYNGTEIAIVPDSSGPVVNYDAASKQLTIGIDPNNPPTASQIVELINSTPEISSLFEASIPDSIVGTDFVPDGSGQVRVGDRGMIEVQETGLARGAAMLGGSENANLGIVFYSTEYGSDQFVSVAARVGTEFPLTDRYGNVAEKTYGTDVVAKINGQTALSSGLTASMATSDLDLAIRLDASVQAGDAFGFRITGGGALIQLGPNATSEQQARIGIQSVHTTLLGGINGNLSQIRSGETYDLLTDPNGAFKIIEEVTEEISSLRSRLGAVQKSRIEPNSENLTDLIVIETEARSEIADVDFAAESSEMTRQQLLMQANITVLQQTSQSRQMLLGLLQG